MKGCIAGTIFFSLPNQVIIDTSYCSNSVIGSSNIGSLVGGITLGQAIVPNISYSQIYFNNQTSSFPSSSNFNFTSSSVSCEQLYHNVLSFNSLIWNGNNLFIEKNSIFGSCQCCPTTTPPSTTPPSTTPPSTTSPSTTLPTTMNPTTTSPSTLVPSDCLFQVPNCDKCNNTNYLFQNSSDMIVQCLFILGSWSYTFRNSSSNQFYLNENITINNVIYIEGDIFTSPGNVISFPYTRNKTSYIEVNGCLKIEGKINVSINELPEREIITIILIRFNCPTDSKRETFSYHKRVEESQIVVSANFKKSNCEKVSHGSTQGQQTLSVSLSTTSGCKGINDKI